MSVLSEMNVRRMVSGLRMLRRYVPLAGAICAGCDATPGGSVGLLGSCRKSPPPTLAYLTLGSIRLISFASSSPHALRSRYRFFALMYASSLPDLSSNSFSAARSAAAMCHVFSACISFSSSNVLLSCTMSLMRKLPIACLRS